MKVDVDKAFVEYGDISYNGIEAPDFCGDEPMLIFYRPDMLADDDVIDIIDKMPELLANGEDVVYFDDGFARIEAYEFFLQGYDARYLDAYVMGAGKWHCFLQCIVVVGEDTKRMFSYSDMYDAAVMELRNLGIMRAS